MIFGSQIARRTAHTDDRGDYRIEAVRDGPHLVSVSVPDGPRMTTAVELVWGEERLHDIAFGGGSIRGVVVDRETGEALPGARISVFARGGEHGGLRVDATADAQGRFVATGLEPAQWLIGVSAPPYRLADGFVRVDLGPGEAVEDLRVELTKGAVLRGRVVPGPGEPMPPHLGLRVRWPDGSPTGVVWPDDQTGEFVLESLPPGSLTLEVVSLPFGYEELEEAETIAALDVDVSEGEEREVEIPLP